MVLACDALALPALAAQWAMESNLESRTEVNDNPSLSALPATAVLAQSLTATLSGSRQVETAKSGLDLAITAYRSSLGSDPARIDSRLALSQSWADVVDGLSLNLTQARNSTLDTRQGAADVALGRGQRRTTALVAAWSRALNERWSLDTTVSVSRTGYSAGLPTAVDFQNASASADASWRIGPVDSLRLHLGRAEFRTLGSDSRGSGSRADTLDIGLGWQRALDELSSVSVNLGAYSTRRVALQDVLVCPQPIDFCQRGLVAPVLAQARGTTNERGLQYAASYRRQVDEVSDLALSATRAQTPSGAGVLLLGDSLSLVANRAFSDTFSGTFSASQSRTVYRGVANPPKPGFQKMSLAVSKRLTEHLGLQAGWDHSRSFESRSGVSAVSNSVSVTLKYDGFRMFATR